MREWYGANNKCMEDLKCCLTSTWSPDYFWYSHPAAALESTHKIVL